MNKIALTLAAVAALGIAGCKKTDSTDVNNSVDVNATATEAGTDVNGAVTDTNAATTNATDATNSALDTTGNVAVDTGNAATGNTTR